MRFYNYLTEKITKKDINSIIKNKDILVGAEFEFYLTDYLEDYSNHKIMGIDYNTLYDQWLLFINALEIEKRKSVDKMKLPKIPIELEKYLLEYIEEVDLDDLELEEFQNDPDFFISAITELEPSSFVEDAGEDEALDIVANDISNKLGINVVKNNKPSKEGDNWGLEIDPSLKSYKFGFELISPPLPMPDFLEISPKIFDFINKNGVTDKSNGFHAHISIKGIDLINQLNVVKLFLFNDEDLTYKYFDERMYSKHAKSIKDKIKNLKLTKDDVYDIMDIDKLKKQLKIRDRNYGINLDALEHNNIEYRYLGGTDYDKKWAKIRDLVLRYSFNLKLATDKDFMRKEYLRKISKMIDKNNGE